MLSALLSFLGGSAFRMIWGEISAWATRKQEHEHELARMTIQSTLEAERHARDMDRIKLQHELGVKEVIVQADAAVNKLEVEAWLQAVRDVGKQTGIRFIDVWNGAIRPLLATLAISVVVAQIIANGFVLTDWDKDLVAAILGLYVADRTLAKRGK